MTASPPSDSPRLVIIAGPDGAGKTTLIKVLCGMIGFDAGTVSILGLPLPRGARDIKHQIGYLSQRFALYGNLKFPLIIFFSVLVTEPVGGLLALRLTHTNFSVSSMLGFVCLMGVAVQTSVILYSFINKLRLEGKDIMTATFEASLLRLRPIMMTALVACFGLLPAAMSTGIGSDSQKPFAIVIVGGLASRLLLSVFLAPVLYALVARDSDTLKV